MRKALSEKLKLEKENPSSVLCSVDKDLNNTPGWHYNWNKEELYWVSEEEATYNFYMQLLTGDPTDNIQGIPGIGKKKAEKVLEGCETEVDMYLAVFEEYAKYFGSDEDKEDPANVSSIVEENARLLYMVRELDEEGKPVMWSPPV